MRRPTRRRATYWRNEVLRRWEDPALTRAAPMRPGRAGRHLDAVLFEPGDRAMGGVQAHLAHQAREAPGLVAFDVTQQRRQLLARDTELGVKKPDGVVLGNQAGEIELEEK